MLRNNSEQGWTRLDKKPLLGETYEAFSYAPTHEV